MKETLEAVINQAEKNIGWGESVDELRDYTRSLPGQYEEGTAEHKAATLALELLEDHSEALGLLKETQTNHPEYITPERHQHMQGTVRESRESLEDALKKIATVSPKVTHDIRMKLNSLREGAERNN